MLRRSGSSSTSTTFVPADTVTATDVQNAIVEALVDARAYADAAAVTVQAAINELDTEKAAATQEAWQDATYTANWSSVNYPTANKAQYMKDSMGFVHIRGLVKSSGGNGVIFTLPAGYRPAREHTFVIHVDGSVWWMVIEPGGAMNTHSGSTCSNACIDGIYFDTR